MKHGWMTCAGWFRVLAAVIVICGVAGTSEAVTRVQLDDGFVLNVINDITVTGSVTLIAAANDNRAALNCTNTHATVHVRWGSSAVTATSGQQLRATAPIVIKNLGAVYMISEGANVTVSCTEETR